MITSDVSCSLTIYWLCTVSFQTCVLCSLFGCCYDVNLEGTPRPPLKCTKDVEVSLLSLSYFPPFPPGEFLPGGFWSLRLHFHGLPWNIRVESTFPLNLSHAASRHRSEDRCEGQHRWRTHLLSIRLSERRREESMSQQHTVVLTQTFPHSPSSLSYWQSLFA